MKIIEMILRMTGGLQKLEDHPLHVFKPPFLPLRIRHLGSGPRGLDHIAVSQMIPCGPETEKLESELTFEIGFLGDGTWGWYPVSFRQRNSAFFHECAWVEPEGHRVFHRETEEGLNIIANAWDEILVARGYMESGTVL